MCGGLFKNVVWCQVLLRGKKYVFRRGKKKFIERNFLCAVLFLSDVEAIEKYVKRKKKLIFVKNQYSWWMSESGM